MKSARPGAVLRYGRRLTTKARFEARFVRGNADSCWLWDKPGSDGYGRFTLFNYGPSIHASRASWMIYVGPVPVDRHVLHACDTPLCVNPKHLFLGTNAENVADKVAKGRHPRGMNHPSAKLTDEQVAWIRSSKLPKRHMARILGVSDTLIRRVVTGGTRPE